MSNLTITLIIIASIFLAIIILFFIGLILCAIGHKRYNPARAKDVAELRKIAQPGFILIAALENCRLEYGRYPRALRYLHMEQMDLGLKIRFPISANNNSYDDLSRFSSVYIEERRWDYSVEGNLKSFRLSVKLGWDPSLYYSSQEKRWYYEPGDGSDKTRLDI